MPVIDLGRVIGPQGPQGETGAQGIRGEQGLPGPNQVTNSTATPLTGVLTGNGSVVGVETIDAAPTPDSTGFATSGGTDKAIKGRVPVYGKGKNLLRNWYFAGGGTGRGVFPVNQRGATSGTTTNNTYFIDGWKWTYGSSPGSWSLVSDGMSVSPSSSSDSAILFQELGTLDSLLNGEKITASVLYSDGQFYSGSITRNSGTSQTFVSIGGIWVLNMVDRSMRLRFTTARTVVAVKLELGSEQTLCHNEGTAESPVWVLNDVPDYEYELYRCVTSTADSSDTYANKSLATEQQLAPVEWGTTASVQHEVGTYFCWNGLLYRTTVLIPVDGQITPNTNCVRDYAAVPSCYLSTVTFQCNSSGSYTFANGDLPNRATSVPVGCLAKDASNNYINVSDFTINPRYGTAGTFTSVSCANKEVTLFFVNYR